MKRINLKKLMSVLTVSILSLGMIFFTGCNKDNELIEELNQEEYSIYLTSSEAQVVDTGSNVYIEQTLKATVTASVGADISLDWSAKWSNTSVTANVTDYLKVIPDSSDSATAKVRCYKNFEEFGDIIIVAKSKVDSSKYASCVASYIGAPTSLNIKDGSVVISGTTVNIKLGQIYLYNLDLGHALGAGSEYGQYNVTFTAISGTVDIKYEYWASDGKVASATQSNINVVDVSNITNINVTAEPGITSAYSGEKDVFLMSNFANPYYYLLPYINSDKNLSLICNIVYNGSGGIANYGGASCPRYGIKAYTTGCNLTINAIITEVKSNKSVTVNFKIGA